MRLQEQLLKRIIKHFPLELTPDDFWVAISQGIAKHLLANSEKYRTQFVNHEGKKTLEVHVEKYGIVPKNKENQKGWPGAIREMITLIKGDVKTEISDLLSEPFSTTGPIEQTVLDSTLMESLKNYYEYRFRFSCGIPEVILHGTVKDYQSIIERILKFQKLFPDFNWWLEKLVPHIEKIIDSIQEKPNIEWWNQICHSKGGGSDISMISGWLADFIPYCSDGKGGIIPARKDYRHYCQGMINGIETSDLEESITQTEFILDDRGSEYKMMLVAGFFGVSQNSITKALRPVLGWFTYYL